MGKKPRSERHGGSATKSSGKRDAEPDDVPDDFTVAGSEGGETYLDEFDEDNGKTTDFEETDEDGEPVYLRDLGGALAAAADRFDNEKSSKKRESGYKRLFKSLAQSGGTPESLALIQTHLSSLLSTISTAIKNPTYPTEQYAACRILEVVSLILGPDRDDYYDEIAPILTRILNSASSAPMVKSGALRAASMSAFFNSTDMSTTVELVNLCAILASPTLRDLPNSPAVRSTALDCWCLLGSTLPDASISDGPISEEILPLIKMALDDVDADLRAAAGGTVALIHEARMSLGMKNDEELNASERRYRRGSWDGTEFESLIDEVKGRLEELAQESGHHMSKKAKKAQRATFREYCDTVANDNPPEHSVVFVGGVLELSTWREIKQLECVRSCLQSGFQGHMLKNEHLHGVFDADIEVLTADAGMSGVQKRMFKSKNSEASKNLDKGRRNGRTKKTNVSNDFLMNGDEY